MRATDWFHHLPVKQQKTIPYLFLAGAVFAVYANVYQNAFMLNDLDLITNNDAVHHWSGFIDIFSNPTLQCFYRPVQVLCYLVIYQIFGLSLVAFHGLNVLLQAANACLMYRLGCRLGFYPRAAFAAALLWGVHPLWIEAVTVVAGTADPLVGFFCMTGFLILLPDFAPRKFWLASLLFILALGSKESAVVFPALVTLSLALVSKERERLRIFTYFRTWPLWLLAIGYIAGWMISPIFNCIASATLHSTSYIESYDHNFINRVLTFLATLPVYFGLIVTPANLHIAWVFPVFTTVWDWHVITGVAIVVIALLQIIQGCGKGCGLPLAWGLLWFAIALSPNIGILKPIDGQLYEHWIYLPTIGLFLGVFQTAAVWVDNLRSKKAPVIVAGVITLATLVLGISTYHQNQILHDRGSMYENVLSYTPDAGWARYGLGTFYMERGEFDKAIIQYQHIIDSLGTVPEIALVDLRWKIAMAYLHLLPDKDGATFALDAHALQACQHIPEVIDELGKVLQGNPDYYPAHQVLAAIYSYQGDDQMAKFHLKKVEESLQKQGKQGR